MKQVQEGLKEDNKQGERRTRINRRTEKQQREERKDTWIAQTEERKIRHNVIGAQRKKERP